MTRQLVDVLRTALKEMSVAGWTGPSAPDRFVASLLTDGPAEHTIVCPKCEGTGEVVIPAAPGGDMVLACPDCTNGRQTVIVRADIQ